MPSFKSIRKRIYDIIDATNEEDNLSRGYDIFMIIVIAISMIPLMTKAQPTAMHIIDRVTVTIFIIDYLLRLLTADFKFERKRISSLNVNRQRRSCDTRSRRWQSSTCCPSCHR